MLSVLLATAVLVVIILIILILVLVCTKRRPRNNSNSSLVSITIDIGELPITVTGANSADVTQLIKAMDKVLSDVLYKIDIDDDTRTKLEDLRSSIVKLRRDRPCSRVQTDGVLPGKMTQVVEYPLGCEPGEEDLAVYDNMAYSTCGPLSLDNATCAKLLPNTAVFLMRDLEQV